MSVSKRKPSMQQADMRRKQSVVDVKKLGLLDVPGMDGRRDSNVGVGRRASISGRRMSIMDRKFSIGDSLSGGRSLLSAGKDRGLNIKLENTYKTGPDEIFPIHKAKIAAQEVLDARLEGKVYSKDDGARWSVEISDSIKQRIKAQSCPPRFKVVVIVSIGQNQGAQPSMVHTSRCIWNDKLDNFAEVTFRSVHMVAVALIYAMYVD